MLRFQPITPADRATIERYTLRGASQNCDYAFANMVCWQALYRSEWAEHEGFLLIRFRIDGVFHARNELQKKTSSLKTTVYANDI